MSAECEVLPSLPPRRVDAHKGEFGHVLVVAGSPGMTGAGCMAALAAQRAGAGLVTLGLPQGLNLVAEVALRSAMSMPLPQTPDGVLGLEAASRVLEAADRFDVFAIGPGLGRAGETGRMVRRLVRRLEAPVVVDADGLNALAEDPEPLGLRAAPTVLTPHPGEMSRLIRCAGAAEVQADRTGAATRFARERGVVVVLKGRDTVVTDGQRLCVNQTGNPGMATGGTGDVLTGLIAGLLCQALDAFNAARLGVFVHGLAGDLAAGRMGMISLVAEDVLDCVPTVLRVMDRLWRDEGGDLAPAAVRAAVLADATGGGRPS